MPAERYFYEGPLTVGQQIQLSEAEQRHLIQVMRTRPGETVEIVNGTGYLASAVLLKVEKRSAPLEIAQLSYQEKPGCTIILAQAIPRSSRLDLVLEKGTELGMSEIWLFPGQLSEKVQIGESLLTRLRTITISAMKQCGRLYLPLIKILPSLLNWESPALTLFYGDLSPQAPPLYKVWSKEKFPEGGIFIVGPEKGFSSQEVETLSSFQAHGVRLHQNILRTETASIVALSLVNHLNLT